MDREPLDSDKHRACCPRGKLYAISAWDQVPDFPCLSLTQGDGTAVLHISLSQGTQTIAGLRHSATKRPDLHPARWTAIGYYTVENTGIYTKLACSSSWFFEPWDQTVSWIVGSGLSELHRCDILLLRPKETWKINLSGPHPLFLLNRVTCEIKLPTWSPKCPDRVAVQWPPSGNGLRSTRDVRKSRSS